MKRTNRLKRGDPAGRRGSPTVFTIGHSNLGAGSLHELLTAHGISLVVDVRSHPRSSYVPHFDRDRIGSLLDSWHIQYAYLGGALGGRPRDPSLLDPEGRVLYGKLARTSEFRGAIASLVDAASRGRIAVMCAEGSPETCHRRLLISPALRELGVETMHILPDGSAILEEQFAESEGNAQGTLFEGSLAEEWRSSRSVLPKSRRRPSSRL